MLGAVRVYTIGQGSRSVSGLIAELEVRSIRFLCDVRSVPISNYAPEFCRDELKAALRARQIAYVSFSDTLGGRPTSIELYDDSGRVSYDRLICSDHFKSGIERVVQGACDGHLLALFCSEGRPELCHRSKAIGRSLEDAGVSVLHIDADGTELDQQSAMKRLATPLSLLGKEYPDPQKSSRRAYR